GMSQLLQETSLAQYPAPVARVVQAVWAQCLGDAAARALRAPYLIDVERISAPHMGHDCVTRGKLFAVCCHRNGLLLRLSHLLALLHLHRQRGHGFSLTSC